MFNRLILLVTMIAMVILTIMLNFTTPAEIGPLGVLAFLGLVYIVMFALATGVIWLFARAAKRKELRRKDYYYGAAVAFGPILLRLMSERGAMTVATVVLVGGFVFLGCFLVNKRL